MLRDAENRSPLDIAAVTDKTSVTDVFFEYFQKEMEAINVTAKGNVADNSVSYRFLVNENSITA